MPKGLATARRKEEGGAVPGQESLPLLQTNPQRIKIGPLHFYQNQGRGANRKEKESDYAAEVLVYLDHGVLVVIVPGDALPELGPRG